MLSPKPLKRPNFSRVQVQKLHIRENLVIHIYIIISSIVHTTEQWVSIQIHNFNHSLKTPLLFIFMSISGIFFSTFGVFFTLFLGMSPMDLEIDFASQISSNSLLFIFMSISGILNTFGSFSHHFLIDCIFGHGSIALKICVLNPKETSA